MSEKIFPRNLTARAAYVVRGNPVTSRPESGADNSHPGLEFDMRNLDRGFFPGLLFDFQFGVGARLAEFRPRWCSVATAGETRDGLDAADGDLFLWYIFGRFGDQPDAFAIADLYGIDGYEVLRKVHDLERGPLAIVVGRHPDKLDVSNGAAWLAAAMRLQEMAERLKAGTLGDDIQTFRAVDGSLQFAILASRRADYVNSGDGVINLETVEPGALTRSLCAPWQWDFADCGCYYWAASRPDIVTDAQGEPGRNFLRNRNEPAQKASPNWAAWMKPDDIMTQAQMLTGWEQLPLVIEDQETDRFQPKPLVPVREPWGRATIVEQLKHLAAVEHALCVRYLYAHYSVNAPDDPDAPLSKAAHEVLTIAIDEMRHFRWVNEALVLLNEPPVFARATKLSAPPRGVEIRQHPADLGLTALTSEALQSFIELEAPSRKYGNPDDIEGLYTHILVSLRCDKAAWTGDADKEVRERLQEVIKLLIDEGHDHWLRFRAVQALLPPDTAYLRYKGGPQRIARAPASMPGLLQSLGDQYYCLTLDIMALAFEPPGNQRGGMIAQARRVMHSLHEIGHQLALDGEGLLFTLPRPLAAPLDVVLKRVRRTVSASVPRLLAGLGQSDRQFLQDMAPRHGQVASDLRHYFTTYAVGNEA